MTSDSPSESFRAASYNIRKCIGLDRRRDPGRVMDVINDINADVVMLQEADRRLGHRPAALPRHLVETHSDFTPVHFGTSELSLGWHGNAVLVHRDTELTRTDTLDLPGLEPRGAALVEIKRNGHPLRLVGVHLGLIRASRRLQWSTIIANLAARTPMPTLILGDFNEWSPRAGLEALTGFDVHSPGHSYHAARPIAALDRIAASAGLTLHDAGVVERSAALKASDHLPIWADFKIA